MSTMHPTDILDKSARKFAFLADILSSSGAANQGLNLSQEGLEGICYFMQEQEELIRKVSDALSKMELQIEFKGES